MGALSDVTLLGPPLWFPTLSRCRCLALSSLVALNRFDGKALIRVAWWEGMELYVDVDALSVRRLGRGLDLDS